MYAPSVATGRGMYAQGVTAVSAAGRGGEVGAAGGNSRTLQSGGDGGGGSRGSVQAKQPRMQRCLPNRGGPKKRNAEQDVIVISDDEDGK